MEQSVVRVSAKVANAIEMAQQAKYLSEQSEKTLIEASLALEELYIAFCDTSEKITVIGGPLEQKTPHE